MEPNMTTVGFLIQGLWLNAAILTAAATMFGAIIVFVIMYLFLERKKKTLIVVFLAILTAFGLFYWRMSRHSVAQLDLPKPVITTTLTPSDGKPGIMVPIPEPRPRPHAKIKKAAQAKPKPPIQLCPKQLTTP